MPIAALFPALMAGGSAIAGSSLGAAALMGGASLGSALIGSNAAKKASQLQADAAHQATDTQWNMFNLARGDLQPFREIGTRAASTLGDLYGVGGGQPFSKASMDAFTSSPDYAFAKQQGETELDRMLTKNGMFDSGAALKGAQRFGQGLATNQFGNYFQRLMSLSQLGAGAAQTGAGLAQGSGQGIANTQMGLGQAQASGVIGSANALSGGLNNAGSMFWLSNMMKGHQPPASPQSAYPVPEMSGTPSTFSGW